ncbi:hypothetical protein KK488_07265 [Sphingobium sp. H33]|uniref:Uncharacterized protein n=2 Tax=Sphingobium nicotianae TaxID=2782607 RepID=A0A9X1IQJ2_9SPHN|nr:hypothetical protein [Sphingobium nicotianae]
MLRRSGFALAIATLSLLALSTMARAHKLRVQGAAVTVAGSSVTVTPSRDWNSLGKKIGKNTETWTLDGEQLNDVTFFAGIAPGNPLVKERSKKHAPLPKFTRTTLLVEVPELLEGTHRTYKNSGAFKLLSTQAATFLGRDGVFFTYEFTDEDQLTRRGEAHAAIIDGKLFMMTFEAPRLGYFARSENDFRALVTSARLR